jgi:hypothetical protein
MVRADGGRGSATQRRRARNGSAGEDLLELHHVVCRHQRVADVVKIGTEMRIVGSVGPGVFRAVFARPSGCDYRGHLLDGSGRGAYIEAKHVEDPTRRFALRDVREVQRAQLEGALAAGCVAVLAIVLGPRRDLYAVPWSEARTHASLGPDELASWWVKPGDAYLARWAARPGGR